MGKIGGETKIISNFAVKKCLSTGSDVGDVMNFTGNVFSIKQKYMDISNMRC